MDEDFSFMAALSPVLLETSRDYLQFSVKLFSGVWHDSCLAERGIFHEHTRFTDCAAQCGRIFHCLEP